MGDLLCLFVLPCAQKRLAAVGCQENCAVFLLFKVMRLDQLLVDAGQHEPVGIDSAQFFHQIQGQAFPARPWPMEKTNVGVQADTLQCGGTVPGKQRVSKGEERVEIVQRRPTASSGKEKVVMLL